MANRFFRNWSSLARASFLFIGRMHVIGCWLQGGSLAIKNVHRLQCDGASLPLSWTLLNQFFVICLRLAGLSISDDS
eukprot:scaffold60601_cov32-Tisochrysis_lutea.AAC.2